MRSCFPNHRGNQRTTSCFHALSHLRLPFLQLFCAALASAWVEKTTAWHHQALLSPVGFPGTSMHNATTQGAKPCFGSTMSHPGPISALSLARPSTVGACVPGFPKVWRGFWWPCYHFDSAHGTTPIGVTASPGVPAALYSHSPHGAAILLLYPTKHLFFTTLSEE